MNRVAADILVHYGTKRHSGRYPWGSGDSPYQRNGDFIARVQKLRKSGMSEKDIAESMGFENTTQLRRQYSRARTERRRDEVAQAKSLRSDGLSDSEIGRVMGKNESTIRSLLNEKAEARMNEAQVVADYLREQINTKGMIDVGIGVERELNISREKMNVALDILQEEGYPLYGGGVPQATNPGRQTNIQVIGPPGTEHQDIYKFDNVHSVTDYKIGVDADGNDVVDRSFKYPSSMDSERMHVRYGDEGGSLKDGVIEIRRGVDDLSLGESHYAQVRILVDGDKYMKGMAVYSDDMPDGVDVVFNTNKQTGTPLEKVLKPIKDDPENPFGSLIKEKGGQSEYFDENGERHLSLINKRAEEGDWDTWSKTLPSQFLSKQNMPLINKQLDMAIADKQAEFDEIMSITNPTVKKEQLASFAEDCDSTAVHLDAAALPRQRYQVILPANSLKDNEVYAPNYENGETVALIRYPHGSTSEIPILTVNNKNAEASSMLTKNALDAVAINSNNAARLSGADFDGDTVMVVPCNSDRSNVRILSTAPLKGLEGFDPKMEYPEREGMKYMSKKGTQTEMGKISNLITDMTLKGAPPDELARAIRHSMVVIDAEKHKLDYKMSESENGISTLKERYQGYIDADGQQRGGASTLISRAKGEVQINKRVGTPKTDPETGGLIYKEVQETYIDKNGKTQTRMYKSTQMAETSDARTLSSGTLQEEAYASYANKLKALANQARKEVLSAGKILYSKSARETYQEEVDSLTSQLHVALKNAPRERKAQLAANAAVKATKESNPGMTNEELRKAGQRALSSARARLGAKRTEIVISDREWAAIQAGAVTETTLKSILRNTNSKALRQRATPKATTTLSSAKVAKIKAMQLSGYTNAEIANSLGVSSSTVVKYLSGG